MILRPTPAHRATSRSPFREVAVLACVVGGTAACGTVPVDPGPRIFPAQGVIRGTVSYQGPRPCSRAGHIVGNAVLLVFDRRDPPPPEGVAATAVNFVAVTGDVLFPSEPRYTGADAYCPAQAGFTQPIASSAPFEVAPLAGASYEIRAFFDYTGDFLPEFSIRDLPEQGDIAGGAIDTADALKAVNVGNPNYRPRFLPIDVGIPQALSDEAGAGSIPDFAIPDTGFVADGITVTLGAPLPTPRPYFFPQGEEVDFDLMSGGLTPAVVQSSDGPATDSNGIAGAAETDTNAAPILTIPQDIGVLAPPASVSPASANYFESKFPHLRLAFGLPSSEIAPATAPPFDMQVAPFGQPPQGSGFLVWQDATLDPATQQYTPLLNPEGNGVPQLWPQVVLQKIPDPLAPAPEPVVLLEAITLLGGSASDTLLGTVFAALGGSLFPAGSVGPQVFAQDHVTVLLRPSAICLPSPFSPGTLVTPHETASTADIDCTTFPCVPDGAQGQPVAPPTLLQNSAALASLVNATAMGCLPLGRYAINVLYPDGQSWTVPNEAGLCSAAEGAPDYADLLCSPGTPDARPILYSQGARAVVEVVAPSDPAYCQAHPVPAACLTSQ